MENSRIKPNSVHTNPSGQTTGSNQNPSPIPQEVSAAGRSGHALSDRIFQQTVETIYKALRNNQVDALNYCIQKLSYATLEEIYRVLSHKENWEQKSFLLEVIDFQNAEILELVCDLCKQLPPDKFSELLLQIDNNGNNCLLQAISIIGTIPKSAILQLNLVCDLCKLLLPDKFSELLLQIDNNGNNCLLQAILFKNPDMLSAVLDLCDRLSQDDIQALLQEDRGDSNCLKLTIVHQTPAMLFPIIDLYTKVSPQILKDAMRGLNQAQKALVKNIITEINQRSIKSARNA